MLKYALSIRQPWAWAILKAGKDIENRSWTTKFRGRFYIHAAMGMKSIDYAEFRAFYENPYRFVVPGLPPCPKMVDLQRGGIIGTAELTDCVDHHDSPWFAGPHGFVLTNARRLPFVPMKGSLGFFLLDDDTARALAKGAGSTEGQ